MQSMGRLAGKIAVVTGAGSGIGRGIALRFAAEGATVIAVDISGAEEQTAALSKAGTILPERCDVSAPDQVEQLFRKIVTRHSRLDVLANNAGISNPVVRLHETRLEDWDRVFAVNVRGAFLVLRAALSIMVEQQRGAVVNTASVASFRGNAGTGPYGVSKGAMLLMTRIAALDYAKDNIRINAICPGLIETPLVAGAPPEIVNQLKASIPVGRLGTPEEVGSLAVFLASDEASYVTGAAYVVDGGATAG